MQEETMQHKQETMQHKIQNKLLGFVRGTGDFMLILIAIAIIISALALIPDLWRSL